MFSSNGSHGEEEEEAATTTTSSTTPTTTTATTTTTTTTTETTTETTTTDTNSPANETHSTTTLTTNTTPVLSPEERLLNSLIDDVIFFECLQVHRAAKMGLIFTEPGDEMYKIKDGVGLDVFGQPLSKKKQYNCTCPNCNRNLAASRLAPHLEKCMGMGRLSARAASNKRDT